MRFPPFGNPFCVAFVLTKCLVRSLLPQLGIRKVSFVFDNPHFMASVSREGLTLSLVLMREHSDLYGRLIQVYPKVQQMIHA